MSGDTNIFRNILKYLVKQATHTIISKIFSNFLRNLRWQGPDIYEVVDDPWRHTGTSCQSQPRPTCPTLEGKFRLHRHIYYLIYALVHWKMQRVILKKFFYISNLSTKMECSTGLTPFTLWFFVMYVLYVWAHIGMNLTKYWTALNFGKR